MKLIPWDRSTPTAWRHAGSAWVAAVALVSGCDDRLESVRSYTVPKETPPPAMAPDTGVTPTASDLAWELPAGWSTAPNPNTMRFATLTAGIDAELMEVSVTRLSGAAGGVAANINRWRGQIGLPPAGDAELAESARTVEARGARGVMVDLVSADAGADAPRMFAAIFAGNGETWFIKAVGTREVLELHRAGFDALCASAHFIDSDGSDASAATPTAPMPTAPTPTAPAPGAAGDETPRWSALPAGWSEDAQPKAMSVSSITVTDRSGDDASLTITPLGLGQDMLANINRWRRQVGLGPAADLADAGAEAIEIDGAPGMLVDIDGTNGRTLGAVTIRGTTTWFFKLSGPNGVVAAQRDPFEQFLRSLRFDRATP